jgi:8-oxo-dGTP diphosphatase
VASRERTVQHDFYVYVDTVVLTIIDRVLHVLVVQRRDAERGMYALPGGLVESHEDLSDAAARELREETGLNVQPRQLHQIGAYGDPKRDTRFGRAITVAYLAMIPTPDVPDAGSDATSARFIEYRRARSRGVMEFDHRNIVGDARRLARQQLEDTPIALDFCHKEFTLSDLRQVYEAFYQRDLDPANFRRKVEAIPEFLVPLDFVSTAPTGAGRPARLYRKGLTKHLYPPIYFRRQDLKSTRRTRDHK